MIGTVLNVIGILVGGIAGAWRKAPPSQSTDSTFKVFLGAFAVYYGLRLTWISVHGNFGQILKQLGIAVLAMMLGNFVGQLLRLQELSNRLGRDARERITNATSTNPQRTADGFKACSALFCAAPLGWLGAIQDGLSGYFFPLGIKSVMEGLATAGFVQLFGWGSVLSALPVLAVQGSISLSTMAILKPFLLRHDLLDSVNAVGGLLVFSVALVILNLKKIKLADYFPSLIFAPLLTWLFRLL